MKIYLERKNRHIVMDRMIPHLNSRGHFISDSSKGCDVQLSFIRIEKDNGLPIIVRIDGIYYNLDENYKARNSEISLAHSQADGVVYQSNYSKSLCEKFLSARKKGAISKVVYNGIDPNWCGERKAHDGINIIVISKWRRLKRLKEIIDLFLDFLKVEPNSTLHVLGKLHDNKPVKHDKIVYYGMVDRKIVGDVLNIADFSLHLCKRDSCPNSVIETIAAEVPVITTNKCGGATEICSMTEGCIVCDGDFDSDFLPARPYSEEFNIITPQLRENIISAMIKLSRDKVVCKLPDRLTARFMAESYIDIMEKVR